jgi:cytochrome c oxidase cbb3-type subunit 3
MHDTGEPKESHNRIPRGWLFFFFGVIVWLLWYIVSFTPAISGWSFYKNFEKEMAASVQAKTEDLPKPDRFSGDSKAIDEGKSIYASHCASCHKDDATGGFGPNLTGNLKFGSTSDNIYESIANGRPKGMPPFLPQLGKDRIAKVIAFLETLRK